MTDSDQRRDYREDPDWLLARAEYLFPDSSDRDAKMFIRIRAAQRMRDLETDD